MATLFDNTSGDKSSVIIAEYWVLSAECWCTEVSKDTLWHVRGMLLYLKCDVYVYVFGYAFVCLSL